MTAGESDHPVDHALVLTGNSLTIEDVVAVARGRARLAPLSPESSGRAVQSRAWVDQVAAGLKDRDGDPLTVYGVNTPYGSLAFKNRFEELETMQQLARNLIVSHSAGVGNYFTEDVVRAAMLIRANTLAKGFSGIRLELINTLLQMLNADVYPAVPEKGSVGASGDLAPLSHLMLVLSRPPVGEDDPRESGEVWVRFDPQRHDLERDAERCLTVQEYPGKRSLRVRTDARSVMEELQIPRWVLGPKEGLALNNGTTFSTALAALAVYDAEQLVRSAEIALAMSLESVKGYRDAFLPHVHRVRGYQGAMESAENVRRLVEGSRLLDGDQSVNPKRCPPQDAYSIRCGPQVIGAVRDVLRWVRGIVETELNAVTDNPILFTSEDSEDPYYLPRDNKAISGGNFHAEPIAFAMDFLGIAIAELGSISERRIFRLLTETLNRRLDAMLVHSPEDEVGMRNGFMLAQYTAAALASENKTLAHPDSVDSIPTSENQEDHVSMAPNAARHTREILWNVQQIVGIEMLCAAQALDFRKEGYEYNDEGEWVRVNGFAENPLGQGTRAAHALIRQTVPHWQNDRVLYPDIAAVAGMVASGAVIEGVEAVLDHPLK